MGGESKRTRISWALAFSLHLLAFIALRRQSPQPPSKVALTPFREAEIEIDLSSSPASLPSPPSALAEPDALARSLRAPIRRGAGSGAPDPLSNETDGNGAPPSESTWSLGAFGSSAPDPTATTPNILPIDLLRRTAAADGVREKDAARVADAKSIQKPDLKTEGISFARANPLRTHLSSHMSDPNAPYQGMATLTFVITRTGVSIAGVRSTTNDGEWETWARDVTKNFDTSSIRLPERRDGLRVSVMIDAFERSYEGVITKDRPPPGAIVKGSGLGASETDGGQIALQLPSVTVGFQGQKCAGGATIGVTGVSLGGGCDFVPPTRQTRVRIVEESVF